MDKEVVEQKLDSLIRCLERIEDRCPLTSHELQTDLDAQDIVSLNLTRAVQICVDIALHWAAQRPNLKSPTTMGESFSLMSDSGVIPKEVALSLRKAVGFRNLAVHNYDVINWDIVHHICKDKIGDFRAFVEVISTMLLAEK